MHYCNYCAISFALGILYCCLQFDVIFPLIDRFLKKIKKITKKCNKNNFSALYKV